MADNVLPLPTGYSQEVIADQVHLNFRAALQALENIADTTPHLIDDISLSEDCKVLWRVMAAARYKRMGVAL